MESSSNDSLKTYGVTDLHSYKDYVVFVMAYAPDLFPHEDWLPDDKQLNLDRAFDGLRAGLQLIDRETKDATLVGRCTRLIEEAHELYRSGNDFPGQQKLEQLEALLKRVPSR
jgi:hypothetical protein